MGRGGETLWTAPTKREEITKYVEKDRLCLMDGHKGRKDKKEEGHEVRKDTRQGKIERDATGPNGRIVYQYYYFFSSPDALRHHHIHKYINISTYYFNII